MKIVILGAGVVGMETAIYLNSLGKDVTVVEMKDDWRCLLMHKDAMKIEVQRATSNQSKHQSKVYN